jgi:methyl-accepting chemotaxis protein
MTKIKNKLLLAFILVSLIPLVVLGGYGLKSITQSLESASVGKLSDKVSLYSFEVEDFLKNVSNDLFYLRDSVTLRNLVDSIANGTTGLSSSSIDDLKKDFLAFSKHKKIYYQVRFLDAKGMEVVRVDRNQGESIIVPENRLQNKKSRYYFADTAKLGRGKLMISPLDLNREHGEVEKPLRPVIRYGTPVFDRNNKLAGIVLFNVSADKFLALLQKKQTGKEKLFFIDQKGFYYFNPDSGKSWGSPADLDNGNNFGKDFPEAAANILASKAVQTVKGDETIIAASPVFLDNAKNKQLGTIVNIAATKDILSSVLAFRNIFLLIGAVVFLATLFLAMNLARSITNPLIYLTEATMNMSKGKLSESIMVTTKDETKLLADSIERLRKSMIILLKRKK